MRWYIKVFKQYADFSGRARRKEFWMFLLFNSIFIVAIGAIDIVVLGPEGGVGILSGIYNLAIVTPSLAVTFRRLHDTGRSGWWFWISAIPILGTIVLFVFLVQDSEMGSNGYGVNPK